MEVALVVAIIRTMALEATERALQRIGVRGITVFKGKGFGEHVVSHDFLSRDWADDDVKIEVYAGRDQAELIASTIMNAAHSGSPGDGIVAILPVERVYCVRTRSETVPNRPRVAQP
jgi:nitrogen regulatory protein P-II 1